jgi:gamma-glutamyltranspeptidase/glutathione hydrolase
MIVCIRVQRIPVRLEDFAAHAGNYVEPISALYRGFEIYECPPNGQGLAVLIMLRALSGYELAIPRYHEADRIHLVAEVTKAAYGLRDAYFCDPAHHPVKATDFLSNGQAERIRQSIRLHVALPATAWSEIEHKDTVYLAPPSDRSFSTILAAISPLVEGRAAFPRNFSQRHR